MGKGRDRLYWREGRGWYMDLRDLGGGQKACIPEGQRGATQDRDEATRILSDRIEELRAEARGDGPAEDPLLREYGRRHLRIKADFRKAATVSRDELSLRHFVAFFGDDARLSDVDVERLTDYLAHRRTQPGSREGTTVSEQTLLNELNALSSLFKRAVAEDKAPVNPVRRLPEKPSPTRGEAEWLEPGEAARLIRAAGEEDADPHPRAFPHLRPLIATFLLTGGRKEEVLGMLAGDVDFDEGIVHIRPNRHRTLKKPSHRRHVPLWPQLREILTVYLDDGCRRDPRDLLFRSPRGGKLKDPRAGFSNAVEGARIDGKRVTFHTLRHTYAATRLQTTDGGAAVSPYTVMRELGHASLDLIERHYGHLLETRNRIPVVEYREGKVIGDLQEAREARSA